MKTIMALNTKTKMAIILGILFAISLIAVSAKPLFADDTIVVNLETVPGFVQDISDDISVEIKDVISRKNADNISLDIYNSSDKKERVSVNGRNIIVLPEDKVELDVLYSEIAAEQLIIKHGKTQGIIPVVKWDARYDMPDPLNVTKRERKVLEIGKDKVTPGVYLNATMITVNDKYLIIKVKSREDYLKINSDGIVANQEMFISDGTQFGLGVEGEIMKTIEQNGAIELSIPYKHYEDAVEYNMSVDIPVGERVVTVVAKDFTRK